MDIGTLMVIGAMILLALSFITRPLFLKRQLDPDDLIDLWMKELSVGKKGVFNFRKQYCPNCAKPVRKSDKFCPFCGEQLRD